MKSDIFRQPRGFIGFRVSEISPCKRVILLLLYHSNITFFANRSKPYTAWLAADLGRAYHLYYYFFEGAHILNRQGRTGFPVATEHFSGKQ